MKLKSRYFSRSKSGIKNGSFTVLRYRGPYYSARWINGDFMGLDDHPNADALDAEALELVAKCGLNEYPEKVAKALLPSCCK